MRLTTWQALSVRRYVAEQTIAALPATCRHCLGEATFTRGTLAAHEASCPSAPNVRCDAGKEGCTWDGRESERVAHQAACPLARLLAHFEDERRVIADVLVTVAGNQGGTNNALLLASRHASLAHVVQRLLAEGADVNTATPVNGATALHLAAQEGNLRVAERLIAAGADVNTVQSGDGATALHLAAQDGHLDVVERLIAAGADVDKKCADSSAGTALCVAAYEGQLAVVERLILAKADVNAMANTEDVNAITDVNATPLHLAALQGHVDVVERLIVAGADLDMVRLNDGLGTTPLYVAVLGGHVPAVQRLIAAGADVDVGTDNGGNPLYIAAFHGNVRVVELLLGGGRGGRTSIWPAQITAARHCTPQPTGGTCRWWSC